MANAYRNFAELHAADGEGAYNIVNVPRGTDIVIIAPHGGAIEPGTSELASAIAGAELTTYLFEGRKARGNGTLHITSASFDEPSGLATVASGRTVVALHGESNRQDAVVYLGGREKRLGQSIRARLQAAGFIGRTHANPDLQGVSPQNICNRGRSGAGVQLELSDALRRQLFSSLDAKGRSAPTPRFYDFVNVDAAVC